MVKFSTKGDISKKEPLYTSVAGNRKTAYVNWTGNGGLQVSRFDLTNEPEVVCSSVTCLDSSGESQITIDENGIVYTVFRTPKNELRFATFIYQDKNRKLVRESLQDIAVGIDEYTIRKSLGIFSCIPLFNFPIIKRDNYKVGIL